MSRREHVFKVYWPVHLCKSINESGYLVGWNLGKDGIVVACKSSFVNAAQIHKYISEFHHNSTTSSDNSESSLQPHIQKKSNQRTNASSKEKQLSIVGYLSRESEGLCELDIQNSKALWLEAFTVRTQVGFRSVQAYGAEIPGRIIAIIYNQDINQPRHMYTARPINLDLTKCSVDEKAVSSTLQNALDCINLSAKATAHLQDNRQSKAYTTTDASSNDQKLPSYLQICRLRALSTRTLPLLLWLLNVQIFGIRLKELSAFGQQLDLVIHRILYLVKQHEITRPPHSYTYSTRQNAQYIGFWNSIWVFVADIIFGCIAGILLLYNSRTVADFFVTNLKQLTVTSLEQSIAWLRGWPAGLKLNNGLDGFLAELFIWLIHFWTITFHPFTQYFRAVVLCAGWSGLLFGFSMQLAILSDMLALSTLHTYWFYMVATRIFHWQLITLYSLFNLFRGRKHNVLRNRIDSCDYNLDQLLIGTMLFTLLVYLFPTVFVYYLTFALRRIAIIMAQGLLEILLGIVNHFPILYITLRLKDPRMFPGGVSYDVDSKYVRRFVEPTWDLPGSPVHVPRDPLPLSARRRLNVTVIQMHTVPLPFSTLFFQYYQLWAQFNANYLSWGVLRSLIVGNVVRSVSRLQHTMIPGLSANYKEHIKTE